MRKGRIRTHDSTDSVYRIDSFDMVRHDHVVFLHGQNRIITLQYRLHDRDHAADLYHQDTRLTTVSVWRQDGIRQLPYWVCPICGSRHRFLYLTKRGLRCRVCARLNYPTQQKWHDCTWYAYRAFEYAERYLHYDQTGLVPIDLLWVTPGRPKGMHLETYQKRLKRYLRLRDQYEAAYNAEALEIMRQATLQTGRAARKGSEYDEH